MDKQVKISRMETNHYPLIPGLYARGFGDQAWPQDWYDIPQFDPDGNWILFEGQEPVGFLISFLSNHVPYISVVTVIKEKQGKGYGRKMLLQAIGHWTQKGYEKIRIHVNKDRLPALSLYESMGFKRVGENDEDFELVLWMDKYTSYRA